MASSLEIQNVQTLSDLRSALARFSGDIEQALQTEEKQIEKTLEWLGERIRFWQREVERAQQAVRQAQADLRRCEASGYTDKDGNYHRPSCSHEIAALHNAERHLQTCRENLENARTWLSKVSQAVDAYHKDAHRLATVAGQHSEKARGRLDGLYQKYEAVRQAQVATGIREAIAGGVVALGSALASQASGHKEVGIGEVRPNATYRSGRYEYQTDAQGRVKSVYAKLQLKQADRSSLQTAVGKMGLPTDEGGHLIGARFGGPTDAYNLIPQDAHLNRRAWKRMENSWATSLESGHRVEAAIAPVYRSQDIRPTAFEVVYEIDRSPLVYMYFRNGSG